MSSSILFIISVIQEARKRKELTQRELSKKTNIPQSHISKIERVCVDLHVSSQGRADARHSPSKSEGQEGGVGSAVIGGSVVRMNAHLSSFLDLLSRVHYSLIFFKT